MVLAQGELRVSSSWTQVLLYKADNVQGDPFKKLIYENTQVSFPPKVEL